MKEGDWVWACIFLAFMFWAFSRSETEGVYESNYITCIKPEGAETWRNKLRGSPDRWSAIHEQEYQVSFAHQRVVNTLPSELRDCTVYDRNNWTCGPLYQVRERDMSPICGMVLNRPDCTLPLGWVTHSLVYIAGADWVCKAESSRLDAVFEYEMRRAP